MTDAKTSKFDLDSLIHLLEFFHSSVTLSPLVVTISNYDNGSCVYASPTFKNLTGYDATLLKNGGMNWFVNHLHVEDRSQFKINFTECFLFLLKLPTDQMLRCFFNLTARIIHFNGTPIWIYNQCRPLVIDDEGRPQYSLNVLTDLTHLGGQVSKPCWSVVEEVGAKPVYLGGSCHDSLHWLFGSVNSPLTNKETVVLKHFMQGMAAKQIASKMKISINTINTHRKSIIKKSRSSNISQAINEALKNDWVK